MSKFTVSWHGQARFSERVDYKMNMKKTISQVLKNGIRYTDIPKEYPGLKMELKSYKIYYDGFIYVFSDDLKVLVTVYSNGSKKLRKLFEEKKVKRKESSTKDKNHYINRYILFRDNYYHLTYYKDKLTQFRMLKKKPKKTRISYDHLVKFINRYLKGKRVYFENYISFKDMSPIEEMVYKEVLKIPYGFTISYKELRTKLSNRITLQTLVRILNNCPIQYFIPVHRVIRSDGKIGSFCLDVSVKEELLNLEKNNINKLDNDVDENDFCFNLGSLLVK